MKEINQIKQDILTIAVCIRELSCIIGDNGDDFLKGKLTRIHDDMKDIVHRL